MGRAEEQSCRDRRLHVKFAQTFRRMSPLLNPTPATAKNTFPPCRGCNTSSGWAWEQGEGQEWDWGKIEVDVVSGCCPLVWVGSSCGILVCGSCGCLSEAYDRKQSCSVEAALLYLLLSPFTVQWIISLSHCSSSHIFII